MYSGEYVICCGKSLCWGDGDFIPLITRHSKDLTYNLRKSCTAMKCKQANEFALSSPFLHSQIKKIIPINIIINDTWEKIYIFHFSASACYFQLTSFPIASRDEIWKHLELLEISMDVIGKHWMSLNLIG